MSDSFSVTTSQSWGSRLLGSIKSVLVGLVMIVGAFPVIFWNEGRAVRTARSLKEGGGAVVSVAAAAVDPKNEGRLVHVAGAIDAGPALADEVFGVEAQAVKLNRKVEMFQWSEVEKSETRKKLGGGTETKTTYEYDKEWAEEPIDSSRFEHPEGHENPGAFPVEGKTIVASPVKVGAFELSSEQLDRLTHETDLKLPADYAARLPEGVGDLKWVDGQLFRGANPQAPELGDLRISYQIVDPKEVSLVGVQTGSTFAPYQAKAGDSVLLVEEGVRTAKEMFAAAEERNAVLTWILRAVGFAMLFFGLLLVFRPIAVFADVVPLVGTLLGAGLGFFSFLVAAVLWFLTVAISWIAVRPVLGSALLLAALGALVWLVRRGRAKKAARLAAAPPPIPVGA